MCKKLFIAATGQHCGKTTISLSLMHLARKRYGRVGYIKPIGPKCQEFCGVVVDKDAALMARVFGLEDQISRMSPLVLGRGATRQFLDGGLCREWAAGLISTACSELESECDLLLIEGAGHGGVGSVVGLNNADVASLLDAPVVMVAGGGIGNVIDSVQLNLALYEKRGVAVRMLLVNKLLSDKRSESLGYLSKYFTADGIRVCGAFDYSPVLADPTLQSIAKLPHTPPRGDQGTRPIPQGRHGERSRKTRGSGDPRPHEGLAASDRHPRQTRGGYRARTYLQRQLHPGQSLRRSPPHPRLEPRHPPGHRRRRGHPTPPPPLPKPLEASGDLTYNPPPGSLDTEATPVGALVTTRGMKVPNPRGPLHLPSAF